MYTLGRAGNRTKVEEYKYDEEETRVSASPTRTVDYVYDDLYRLTKEIVITAADGWTRTDAYTYDDVGNRETMVRQTPTEQITAIYTYNEKDQLETEVQTVLQADGGSYAATPTPKRSAGIILAAIASISFTGLLIPFLLLRTSTGGKRARRNRRFIAAVSAFFIPLMAVDPATVCALQNESLAYQALVAAGAANIDPDTTIVEYLYDSNGNTIEKTTSGQAGNSTTTYTYDSENRLIKLDKKLGPQSITTYTYDTEGIRTSQQTGTERILCTVDKNRSYAQVLEQRDESNQLTKRYAYGHDLISQTTNPGQAEESIKYFHYDGQMSTRTLTEGSPTRSMFRQVTDTYTYDAFGNTITQTGSTDNQYKYTGEQFDPNSGFYYLRARYYNQTNGRFISRDSYGGRACDPPSLHRYAYVHNNPVNAVDPTGCFASIASTLAAVTIQSLTFGILLTAIAAPKSFAAHVLTLKNAFSYLMQLDTWKTAGQFVLNGVADLLTDPEELVFTVVMGLLSKVFIVFGLLTSIWDGIKTLGMLKDLMASKSYKMIAVIIAVTVITIGLTFIIGKIRNAGGRVAAEFGESRSTNYRETFFEANPNVNPNDTLVHHAVEQQALKRYPGVVSESEIHSLKNLRGMPKNLNSEVHLSRIRRMWNDFYRENPTTVTKEQLLQKATDIDDVFGHLFDPPVR